jgi:putative ABC transport system permease protein
MSHLFVDARLAIRLLFRNPGFALTLVTVLAAGIAATTAMFSVVVSLFMRPLPYGEPEQLTQLHTTQPFVDPSPFSLPDFYDIKAAATSFSELAGVGHDSYGLSTAGGGAPESIPGARVTGDFFAMLRVRPLHGRLLTPDDDRPGGPRVAVIAADLWHRRFASDPRVVGSTIQLSGEPFTVVGVAPEGFKFSSFRSNRCEVWTPMAATMAEYKEYSESRGSHFMLVMGRRKPGVTLAQAGAQLVGIGKTLEAAHPDSNTKVSFRVLDLHEALVGSSRSSVFLLFSAIGLVFLVVCANVANLLLARAAARRSEMAARAALGATRGRLVAQLVTETMVIFLFASALGAFGARWLVQKLAVDVVRVEALSIDVRVNGTALAFALLIALVCGLVFGLIPALEASRVEPHVTLKETRASLTRKQRLLRGGLVVAQVGVAFALLVGAGLAGRAFQRIAETPLGFEPKNLATASIVLPPKKYVTPESRAAFFSELVARVRNEPGVTAAGANTSIPMGNSTWNGSFRIEGKPPWPAGARPLLERATISPGYFATFGMPILRGRDIRESDVHESRAVAVINQAAVDRYFPNEDPIGHRIDFGSDDDDPRWMEIVGVVGNVKRLGWPDLTPPEAFSPMAQRSNGSMTIVARTERPAALLERMPAIVQSIDPEQPVTDRRLMTERIAFAIGSQRTLAMLLGAFAASALALATLGIFGLVSYTTTQRTRELGIRLALGSRPEQLVALVVGGGLRLVGLGLVTGGIFAVFVVRALAPHLGKSAQLSADAIVFLLIAAVLAVAGVVASLLPAFRAVRIPPAMALRYE